MAAIETGCPFWLTSYNATGQPVIASFNNSADSNFCGYIDDVTGIDFPGVRENAEVFASADGGYHGPFWKDRRPFTLGGWFMPVTPVALRDAAQNKVMGVLGNAFRKDGYCTYTPLGDGIQKGLAFRVQQPIRVTIGQSNVQKKFTIALVCDDWRIRTWTQSQLNATLGAGALPLVINATNNGNADAAPIFVITGPISNPVITNATTGKKFTVNATLPAGGLLFIQLNIPFPTILYNGGDWSQYVDPLNSDYTIAVVPGANVIQLNGSGTSSSTALQLQWNDSWF